MFQSIVEQNLDALLGTEISIREPVDPSSSFNPGVIYDIGRMWLKILKKFLIPGTALTAVQSEDDSAGGVGSNLKKGLVKPSELPIYADDDCLPRETACPERSGFEETISVVRRELWVFFDAYKGYRQRIVDVVETGKSHAESSLNYMAEESNYLPRLGAISLGGVAGFVYSMRGGTARRILYTAAGSGTVAILCYPRSATAISMEALHAVKKGIVITYNFIHGDNQEERAGATTVGKSAALPVPSRYFPDPNTTGQPCSPVPCKD